MTPAELSDVELSAMVAEKVAGWTHTTAHSMVGGEIFADTWKMPDGFTSRPIDYATSADAVLPLLEKECWLAQIIFQFDAATNSHSKRVVEVVILKKPGNGTVTKAYYATAPTFARAACLALLAAHQEGGT